MMVSGSCAESIINQCVDKQGGVRADDFIKKPVSFDQLLRTFSFNLEKL